MNSPDTTARESSTELDATAELPALDLATYQAEAAPPRAVESSDVASTPAVQQVSAAEASADCGADAAPRAFDADVIVEVERWITQKSNELLAQQAALRAAQRERTAGVARADALSRELGATSANLEALNNRARILEEELTREREAVQRGAAALDEAQREASRVAQELTAVRAVEARQTTALAASTVLLQERSDALEALQGTHAALVRRMQDETRMRERLATEHERLQGQLATCLERLQNREAYRSLFESTISELDGELAGAARRAQEQEARANQLAAELGVRERGLQDTVRERDEARGRHDAVLAQLASERGASAQTRNALESRLAELTSEHEAAHARLLAMETALADAQRRAQAEALAKGAAAERLRAMAVEIASLGRERDDARIEIARGRASLSDLTAALERSQTALAEQSRVLEERESVAQAAAASHAELVGLIAALRAQIEELTARLATPAEERRALEERVAALTKEAAESDACLVHLESMNVELRTTVRQLHASLAERDADLQRATRIASTNAYALGRVQSSINELSRGATASESAPAESQASILTRLDGGKNHSFVLRARTTIGRNPDNDLLLAMASVSRHHAVLIPAFRSALLQDLGSTNGVLVNKRRVRCARLKHGDVITFGEAQFRYAVAPVPSGAAADSQTPPRRGALR
jgi:chromosome segregation ATPase